MSINEFRNSKKQLQLRKSATKLESPALKRKKSLIEEVKGYSAREWHQVVSLWIHISSILLFILYKFYWDKIIWLVWLLSPGEVDGSNQNENDQGMGYINMFKNYFYSTRQDQNFAMSIDIEDFKMLIFLNTVFMKNFKIFQKLDKIDHNEKK